MMLYCTWFHPEMEKKEKIDHKVQLKIYFE